MTSMVIVKGTDLTRAYLMIALAEQILEGYSGKLDDEALDIRNAERVYHAETITEVRRLLFKAGKLLNQKGRSLLSSVNIDPDKMEK